MQALFSAVDIQGFKQGVGHLLKAGICSLDMSHFPLRSECSRYFLLTLNAAKRGSRHRCMRRTTVLSWCNSHLAQYCPCIFLLPVTCPRWRICLETELLSWLLMKCSFHLQLESHTLKTKQTTLKFSSTNELRLSQKASVYNQKHQKSYYWPTMRVWGLHL